MPGLEYYDPHPTVLWVGPGVWSLPGRKEAFFMVPAKNNCTYCLNRTKSSWCSHLVSAGLRAGTVCTGKVFKLPLSKVFKKQNPKAPSGRKAPRVVDYPPSKPAYSELPEHQDQDLPDPEELNLPVGAAAVAGAQVGPGEQGAAESVDAAEVLGHQGCPCLGCSFQKGYRCGQCPPCLNRKWKKACIARKCTEVKVKSRKRKSPLALPKGLKRRISPPIRKARKSKTPPSSAANSPALKPKKKRKTPPTSATSSPTRSRVTRSKRNIGGN